MTAQIRICAKLTSTVEEKVYTTNASPDLSTSSKKTQQQEHRNEACYQ